MIPQKAHHIEMLQREFNKRKKSNPRYSMRAFAKFLGMSSPTLSRVLSNNQEISLSDCKKIIKKLKFSQNESIIFVRSVADQKCHRTYKAMAATLESGQIFPHERNLMFVSDLNHRCIYFNDVASHMSNELLTEKMSILMASLGFTNDVVEFIDQCLEKVALSGEAVTKHLPIDTSVGTLVIESLFSPLLGETGCVQAVASTLVNLHLDVLERSCVS